MIFNDNIKEEHLGIKKLHLNSKGYSIFAKNLLNVIVEKWDISSLEDSYYETELFWFLLLKLLNVLLGIFVLAILIDLFLDT